MVYQPRTKEPGIALMMECDECEHFQSVGLIFNGRGSFPDPHQACTECGSKGRFSRRGSKKEVNEFAAKVVAMLHELQSEKIEERGKKLLKKLSSKVPS